MLRRSLPAAFCILLLTAGLPAAEPSLRIALFEADVTPPIGAPLCDALCPPAKEIVDPLLARGVVLLGDGKPVVLCALDWVGIGNSGYEQFREALAKAAGTTKERVAVHCLHQHDAPGCDFDADDVVRPFGLGDQAFDRAFAKVAMQRIATAIESALQNPRTITHVGAGKAKVDQVASNRRVMGPDHRVKYVRYSATKDPVIRAQPEGIIDPYVRLLTFWDGDKPVAVLSYYATHPQSHYGQGGVSCDFPGLARGLWDKSQPGVAHIHFDGAGGNVTAGKYNDGSPDNRMVLAHRLAKGMEDAFQSVSKSPIAAHDLDWRVTPVVLPLSPDYNTKDLETIVANDKLKPLERIKAARNLVWAKRCDQRDTIDLSCLHLGSAYVLNMPGELFVEYQLAALLMRPSDAVMMAAYGDYGPGYIGTAISYTEGGYETGPASRVAPDVEPILMKGMRELLK